MAIPLKDWIKLVRPGAVDLFMNILNKEKTETVKLTEFGKTLRKARIDIGTTLTSMAAEIGVSQGFLSSVEIGKKKISFNLINKIEAYFLRFNVSPAELNIRRLAAVSNKLIDIDGLSFEQQLLIAEFASKQRSMALLKKIAELLDITYM
jgi:transcriptional regulator with XRE-family HTH domain